MDRYDVEKQKWDQKMASDAGDDYKTNVDDYDEVFTVMNTLKPVHAFFALEGKTAMILDLGCGAGWTSLLLAQKAKTVHAIDISTNSIKKLELYMKKYAISNISPAVGDAEKLPYPDNYFDYVFGYASLHHLTLETVIPETSRVLKKGGKAAFCEPFAHNPLINLYRYIKHNFLEDFKGTDKPLCYKDKELFDRSYDRVRFIESSFLVDKVPALRPLELKILDTLPFTRKLVGYITILAEKTP